MLLDDASQHLIAFNAKGTSFIVTNTVLFSRDVLPKYFKHSSGPFLLLRSVTKTLNS